jgi:class 3 adenylate cyclase
MRLGTKILLLTLAITLVLAGVIVWVVTRDLTAHETARAQRDIGRAVSDYFERIASLHAREVFPQIKLIMEEPGNIGQLEAVNDGDESAKEQFRSYVFPEVVQKVLREGGIAAEPAFHVLLRFDGSPLLAFAPDDERLAGVVAREKIAWPFETILGDPPALSRRYVLVDGKLYLAMGLPLKIQVSAAPEVAYFIGFRINDAWAASLLGDRPASDVPTAVASERTARRSHGEQPPQHAWFVVDGDVVAHAVTGNGGDVELPKSVAANGPVDVRRPVDFDIAGEHFIGEAVAFNLAGDRRGALVVASSLTRALQSLRHLQTTIAWVTAGVVVLAVVAFRFVSNFIAGPVRQLVAGTRRVARGEFDEPIVVNRRDELGELAASFNDMSMGLQQRDLVKSTFGKFVDPKIVEGFLADPSRLMPGGEKRVQSVLFSDLKGFTSFAEKLEPDDLVALLNGHLGDAADIVTEMRGIVDKFIGDAVVAFWGAPITGEDEHAGLACVAALRIVRSVRKFDEECARLGVPPLGVRVGVATGEVLVGIIGSANKYSYTVMGDTANLGSRLEGLNKLYGTSVLVSARTAREAQRAVVTRRIDRVRVVGRGEPVELHEVVAERSDCGGDVPLRCEAYAEAMARYERRAWSEALKGFDRITNEWPQDAAARAMGLRCAMFQQSHPNSDWDGVWNATSK